MSRYLLAVHEPLTRVYKPTVGVLEPCPAWLGQVAEADLFEGTLHWCSSVEIAFGARGLLETAV